MSGACRLRTLSLSTPSTMTKRFAPKPSGSEPGSSELRFGLRFISGKYQGGEFPLGEGQEIVIGRSSELDMVLVEEMVSRKHARIALTDGVINIEDLGSTNGTFVNGEKVDHGTLKEGDRVLIGTNILKVIATAQDAEQRLDMKSVAAGRVTARQRMSRAVEEAPRMSGSLEEIPLPDLLQLLGTSKKNGVLVLRTDSREGRIYLAEGKMRFATIEGSENVRPLKAVYRMLEWHQGMFALDPPDSREFDDPVDVSAQEILMEGFRQQDDYNLLRGRLPALELRLGLKLPLEPKLQELSPIELDLLQAAINAPSLEAVFDLAPGTDLEAAQAVLSLLHRGYLEPIG
jgi:pSer/pThr/pTyr-binding forkhead associated (FHA) protein